jgi:hypothetical protein
VISGRLKEFREDCSRVSGKTCLRWKNPSTPINKEKAEVYSQTNGRQECADPIEGVGEAHTEETNSFGLVWIGEIYSFIRKYAGPMRHGDHLIE